jgi:hypothetical protein
MIYPYMYIEATPGPARQLREGRTSAVPQAVPGRKRRRFEERISPRSGCIRRAASGTRGTCFEAIRNREGPKSNGFLFGSLDVKWLPKPFLLVAVSIWQRSAGDKSVQDELT